MDCRRGRRLVHGRFCRVLEKTLEPAACQRTVVDKLAVNAPQEQHDALHRRDTARALAGVGRPVGVVLVAGWVDMVVRITPAKAALFARENALLERLLDRQCVGLGTLQPLKRTTQCIAEPLRKRACASVLRHCAPADDGQVRENRVRKDRASQLEPSTCCGQRSQRKAATSE
eukprot:4238187-Prymnesium_polylepis.1